jgi:prepilin-type N-terminal cleavage/methylation domain-containing protein
MGRGKSHERGMTLLEVTVVLVLASLVTLGILVFYLNAQSTWIGASTQAMTQREATLALDDLTRHVRSAARAEVFDSPDSLHQMLVLRDRDLNETYRYWWDPSDSLLHQAAGSDPLANLGTLTSKVSRFQVSADTALVHLRALELLSAAGDTVRISSTVGLYNH